MSESPFRIEHRYLELPESFYSRVTPAPLSTNPRMVCFNHKLARQMGFHASNPDDFKLRLQGIRSTADTAREEMQAAIEGFEP